MPEDTMIAALLREREGYVQLGLDNRVAEVDEQLRLRGVEPPTADKTTAPVKSAAPRSTPPKGRKTRSAETT